MDTGYLAQQVTTIIGKLHSLFDEIGVPSHDRDSRESELFSSLSETLHNHLRLVASEKNELSEECQRVITTIKQLEESLEDASENKQYARRSDGLEVTFPLNDCLRALKEKHHTVSRLHQERYEQVRKLLEALESYSSHLEPSFLQIELPQVAANGTIPPTFNLSPSYINSVDDEFTRVYEEYNKRVAFVQQTAQEIVSLWAELGTPQAQTEGSIVKYWRESPEQLGLHQPDVDSLKKRKDKLLEEKRGREKKINQMRSEVEALWDRLSVEASDRKAFLSSNRGCGLRAINDLEAELSRLHELKRQNLHLFVEDARAKLQGLWDQLYFSEDEAVEFIPMFCDVYSDALLSAHEAEISRLEVLKDQRLPTLQMIERHRTLVKEREELAATSQDASRLLAKNTKGEKRDPTRLLREEKMRKRIAKELPKVEAELTRILESWEDEYGRPFLVFGERYLEVMEEAAAKKPPPRSKTPNGTGPPPPRSKTPAPSAAPSRAPSTQPPSTVRSKTPVAGATIGRSAGQPTKPNGTLKSPSKIPARVPLGSHSGNSPERRLPPPSANSYNENGNSTMRKLGMAPPPKMRDLYNPPAAATPASGYAPTDVSRSGSVVRQTIPEDPYNDHHYPQYQQQSHYEPPNHFAQSQYSQHAPSMRGGSATPQPFSQSTYSHYPPSNDRHPMGPPPRPHFQPQNSFTGSHYAPSMTSHSTAPSSVVSTSSRQPSNTSSNGTAPSTVSGSENWETYGSDEEEPEMDGREAYYAKPKMSEQYHGPGGSSRAKRGMDAGHADDGRYGKMMRAIDGTGREASWTTDEG